MALQYGISTSTLFIKYRNGYSIIRKEFRNKTPLYRIDPPWIVDLRVLHGLGGVVSYYGTLPRRRTPLPVLGVADWLAKYYTITSTNYTKLDKNQK